jgi:hypothetical protein
MEDRDWVILQGLPREKEFISLLLETRRILYYRHSQQSNIY